MMAGAGWGQAWARPGLAGVTLAGGPIPFATPEIDAGTMASALTLLSGGMLILRGRRRS